MRKFVILSLAYFSIYLLCTQHLCAQGEAESATGALVLQSEETSFEPTIPVGTKISIKYTTDPRTFPNLRLDEVLDSAVVLSGDTVGLQYLDRLVIRDEHRYKTGKRLTIASIAITLLFWGLVIATVTLFYANFAVAILLGVLLVIVGIAELLAFPTGLIIGIVLMATASTNYQLWRKWIPKTRLDK